MLPLEGDGAGLTDWTSGTGELTEQVTVASKEGLQSIQGLLSLGTGIVVHRQVHQSGNELTKQPSLTKRKLPSKWKVHCPSH